MAVVPDGVITKIISVLESEAALLGGVGDELQDIKRELERMRSFLEDCDVRGPLSEREKSWVAEVRDLAYDVEDIIDEFMFSVNRRRGKKKMVHCIVVAFLNDLWTRHDVATRLRKIKSGVRNAAERSRRYGTEPVEGNISTPTDHNRVLHGELALFQKDDDIIGFKDEHQMLITWLTTGEPQRTTISVVGMGGSGKTTLIAKAYKSEIVKRHFECTAWITVSQTYSIQDLFRSLIRQFYEAAKQVVPLDFITMNSRQLVAMLVNYLEGKRYVVVLDDVWDTELWDAMKVALPNSQHGCRVIITTRMEDIAAKFAEVGSNIRHIKAMQENEAWTLFCMKAFPWNARRCPQELEDLAKDVVEKCQGLPLAVVSLGGLFSTKHSELEWKTTYNSLNWELSNNSMLQPIKSILLLSYNDLPYRLKHCFLYCCLFPEDYEIERESLARLWMAEGFIENVRGLTPREIADGYLVELIRRSLLQVVQIDIYGLPGKCKMHDMLRELALSKSEEEKFCALYDEQIAARQKEGAIRRLSIQGSRAEIKLWESMTQLRSFLLFGSETIDSTVISKLVSGFKLLRVLDLQGAPIETFPDHIVTLFNLRYLNMERTQIKKLPESIGRLYNLETLNLYMSQVEALPYGIVNLKNLQYLLSCQLKEETFVNFNSVIGTRFPPKLNTLKNLQVLGYVEANSIVVKAIRSMTQLVRLHIMNVEGSHEEDLCSAIQNMRLLRRLSVQAAKEDGILCLDALKSPPPFLESLGLVGKLENIPQWFKSLQNLRHLGLFWSRLTNDPLPHLGALTNLRRLYLGTAYEEPHLEFKNGFRSLEILRIYECNNLQSITIAKGVMPGLKELVIQSCGMLKEVPSGLKYLTKLQELLLTNVSEDLIKRIDEPSGVDRPNVQHIPKIIDQRKTSSGRWSRRNLSSFVDTTGFLLNSLPFF
ncbi:hypothetical protein Tsubulata_028185 [Turnera subulata]|uniref:Disease resistance protein RPM1-like n=1 Tax=Turnera subulata TaxID=218843 RepID=A0A9Q0J8T5_9ROSI|nr:hypothetical protein Tsubulata_028185 [Turnera subulata]